MAASLCFGCVGGGTPGRVAASQHRSSQVDPLPPVPAMTRAVGTDHYGVEIWNAGSAKSESIRSSMVAACRLLRYTVPVSITAEIEGQSRPLFCPVAERSRNVPDHDVVRQDTDA